MTFKKCNNLTTTEIILTDIRRKCNIFRIHEIKNAQQNVAGLLTDVARITRFLMNGVMEHVIQECRKKLWMASRGKLDGLAVMAAVNKELFSLDVAEQKLRQTVDHGITGFWYMRQ